MNTIMFNAIVPIVMRESQTPTLGIETVLGWGEDVVGFLVTTMNTFLGWMISNPIVLISLILALIVTAVGFLRHLLGA